MQGLVNFSTSIGDAIAVMLPAFCYLAACGCFFFAVWTLRAFAYPHHNHHRHRPWVPFVSLALSGVFATFPNFLTMADISAGTNLVASLTVYTPTTPPNAANILGATPDDTVINVVTLFERFFQTFGAACVFWAILSWRSIVNGRREGSPLACGVQFTFGVMCINILTIANGVVAFFQTGG
jgi:hypothetical protein